MIRQRWLGAYVLLGGCLLTYSHAGSLEPVAIKPAPQVAPATPAQCWVPLFWCYKAPYTCKPLPCQSCDYAKCCLPYCDKPLPCAPPSPGVCHDCYLPKSPVCCFPGNPCGHCAACAKHGCLKHDKK